MYQLIGFRLSFNTEELLLCSPPRLIAESSQDHRTNVSTEGNASFNNLMLFCKTLNNC